MECLEGGNPNIVPDLSDLEFKMFRLPDVINGTEVAAILVFY